MTANKQGALINKEDVAASVHRLLRESEAERQRQKSYVRTIERATADLDELIHDGEWNFLRTAAPTPLVISDAPVVR